MIENIEKINEDIRKNLEEYLNENSKYQPYVFNREPNDKKFPIVIIKELFNESNYTTLKYTDEIYYIDLEINIYAIQQNGVANSTIANEITNLIEIFFKNNYKVSIKISKDVANLDTTVYRNIITVRFKVDTKYKDKLIISPR